MKKEEKLIPGLPSGFEDRWNKQLSLKKKIIEIIENNFLKFGFSPLETPSFEISKNIGSFWQTKKIILCLMYSHLMMVTKKLRFDMI